MDLGQGFWLVEMEEGGIVKHWGNGVEDGGYNILLGEPARYSSLFWSNTFIGDPKDRTKPKFWCFTYYLVLPIFVVIQWSVLRTNRQNMRANWNSRWSVLTTSDEPRRRAQIWDVLHSLGSVTVLETAEPWAHYSWWISRVKCYDDKRAI